VGVLIVFSILVAPALVSLLLKKGLLFAWVYGAVINTAGIVLSFYLDLPTGFSLVFFASPLWDFGVHFCFVFERVQKSS